MFLHATSWGISPSEFWDMTMPEWWLLYEHNRAQQPGDFAGKLTRADVNDLWEYAMEGMTDGAP